MRSRLGEVNLGSRIVKVGAFPISIDSEELDGLARNRETRRRAQQIRAELGNPRTILLGVDRMDYTKGIDVRLKAYAEMLEEGRIKPEDTVLVQLTTPSRERVELPDPAQRDRTTGRPHQRRVRRDRPSGGGALRAPGGSFHDLIAFFVAADVMLVTPLRDGMNLVAKEYVACRSDLGGALCSASSPAQQRNYARRT